MRSLKSPKGNPEANERMTTQVSRLRSGATTAGSVLSRASTVTRASEESSEDQRDQCDQRGDDEQVARPAGRPGLDRGRGGWKRSRRRVLLNRWRFGELLLGHIVDLVAGAVGGVRRGQAFALESRGHHG